MKKQTLIGGIAFSLGVSAVAGSAAFAAPIDTTFKDDAFYGCIAEALNIAPTTAFTDEQLASITDLECLRADGQEAIKDITGIHKLTGLKTLNLSGSQIKTADLALNTNLTDIMLSESAVENVVLPSSAKAAVLSDLTGNGVTINSVSATNLEMYSLSGSKINAISVEQNKKLKKLYLSGSTGLDTLNIANNDALETLDAENTETVFITKATLFDEDALTFDISSLKFITSVDSSSDQDVYTYDPSTKKVTIVNPNGVHGYITIDGKKLYIPRIPLDIDDDEVPFANKTNTDTSDSTKTNDTTKATDDKKADDKKSEDKKSDEELEIPKTSTGKVEEPKEEEKKENPDTSTESKLILGISVLGIAIMGVAVKAIMSARAKRA